jgi:hypothetical protein
MLRTPVYARSESFDVKKGNFRLDKPEIFDFIFFV